MKGAKIKNKLDAEFRSSLHFLRDRVQAGKPLLLTANTENAILMFTDGAFDAETLERISWWCDAWSRRCAPAFL